MSMRVSVRLGLVFSALAALASAAFAADVTVPATNRWDGVYLGIHGGYADGDFTNYDRSSYNCWWCENNYGSEMTGIIGGGTLGYNFTAEQFLLGAEAELGGSSLSGSAKDRQSSTPHTDVDMNFYGTVAARAGIIVGNVLFYAKGGYGFMNADIEWKDKFYDAKASSSEIMNTMVYGGGLEYAFSDSISMKLEYLRFRLDDDENLKVKGYCCGYEQKVNVEGVNTFKVGVNYHF